MDRRTFFKSLAVAAGAATAVSAVGLERTAKAFGVAERERKQYLTPEKIEEIYRELERRNITDVGERLAAFSNYLLGAPYILDTVGEGEDAQNSSDPNGSSKPRFSTEGFSCTSLVEHLLALARSESYEAAKSELDKIRYIGGEIRWGRLRHWPDAQWVPGLIQGSFVEEITAALARRQAVRVATSEVTINTVLVRASKHRHLAQKLQAQDIPEGTFSTNFIPKNEVLAASDALPTGTIVNVVKEPKTVGILERITHQGIIMRREDKIFVRHASQDAGCVVEQPLEVFLQKQNKNPERTFLGLQFLKPLPNTVT